MVCQYGGHSSSLMVSYIKLSRGAGQSTLAELIASCAMTVICAR
ncbi:hypothetical protein [Rhodococcus sp. UFZ-B548]|nr:hypothetical protein [Rhodococcus sp. UFZ-B548]